MNHHNCFTVCPKQTMKSGRCCLLVSAFLIALGYATNSHAAEPKQDAVALSSHNLRAPFCYLHGSTRSWPIVSGALGENTTISLTARQGDKVLARGPSLNFDGFRVSVLPDGFLKIETTTDAKKIAFELEVTLHQAGKKLGSQRLEVRPAPPSRPISYLADLGDDLIYTFHDGKSGRFRPIVKGAFDQYFRRLQAHGVSRLIVWLTPFPYITDPRNYSEEDWSRTVGQINAIMENEELTHIVNRPGTLVSWSWMRELIALRLNPEFGKIFTSSAAEHGIKLTASFRPFEPALTKYYEVPTFDAEGNYLWGFLPLASPEVNYHTESVCFANHRVILSKMGQADAATPASIEIPGIANRAKLVQRFKEGRRDMKIVASHFPPVAADSFVLVQRSDKKKYDLKRYRTVRAQTVSKQKVLDGYRLEAGENGSLLIRGLNIPAGTRYLILSRSKVVGQPDAQKPGFSEKAGLLWFNRAGIDQRIIVRSKAGNRLGRVNTYWALPDSDPDGPMTRVAGISSTGKYRTTFQTIENSIDRLGKNPKPDRLADAELVFDLGADWSVEMLDFQRAAARRLAVRQLKTLLSYPAFDEIIINTRSHCQLAASSADGDDGVQSLAHYRLNKKNYVHLGIDRAFAPISLADDDTIRALASDRKTIEQITTWQHGAWSYDGVCQTADCPYKWRYRRSRAVAAGVRMLLKEIEQEFPGVRIRAVLPPSQRVIDNVRRGMESMRRPNGKVYGSGYYRSIRGSLNHIPAIGEGMAMIDLTGTSIEPVFLGIRFAPDEGPFRLYLNECLKDMAGNKGSKYRGPRSFFYEAQETLRSKSSRIGQRRDDIICELLSRKDEINEVILYEAADWVYKRPIGNPDVCSYGFLDRCGQPGFRRPNPALNKKKQ